MSTILKLAKNRKTARKFNDKRIKIEDIKLALKTALQAPSGANYQPWRFLIITNPDIKNKIRKASEKGEKEFYEKVSGDWADWLSSKNINWRKPFLEEAPVLIMVLSQKKAPYAKESTWLAIGYLLLALEELNLDTVTYTPSDTKKVMEVINRHSDYKLEAILPVGYSKDNKPKEERLHLDTVSWLNECCE
jgi:nitroreductase